MRFIFLDNSYNFTATSINFKALDSLQKILFYFSKELRKKGHEVTIFTRTDKEKNELGINWKNIDKLKTENTDILIVVQETDFLKYDIKAKLKFFLLHYKPNIILDKSILITLLKHKYCFLYTNSYVINNLPFNYKYVPKVQLKLGVCNSFINANFVNPTQANVFVTTHPFKGLDWLIDLWLKHVSIKIPWAELHIYSKLLLEEIPKNIKIKNLKLILELNKNSGIVIKSPLPQEKFISQLAQYKIHLCPSLDNDIQYLSILESQACGIPIIARETISIHDCIYDNETGYVVRDKDNFARKIIQVLNDNKLFSTLRNNSKLNNYVLSWHDAVLNFERKINENTFYR